MLPVTNLPYRGLEVPVAYVAKTGGITIAEIWGITATGTLSVHFRYRPRTEVFTLPQSGTDIIGAGVAFNISGTLITIFADATVPSGSVIMMDITAIGDAVTKMWHTIVAN